MKNGAIDNIMQLYALYGDEDYDGEPVSQSAHMIQCAMLAMAEGDPELILGAFLHDVGHLLKHQPGMEWMGSYGMVNHEGIGADYLKEKGFPERICAIVAHHVAAKRYLVATDKTYAARLSAASRQTLQWQGGPMTTEEAEAFKRHPYFADIITVRRWDEQAKADSIALLPLDFFRQYLFNYVNGKNEWHNL